MEPMKKQPAPDARTHGGTSASHVSALKSKPSGRAGIASTVIGRELSARQVEILEGRGINVELAVRMGWRAAKPGVSGDAIEIPYYRGGIEVNTKTRTISGEKKFHQVAGGQKCMYNLEAFEGAETVVITEGEMDCLVALHCGFAAVSVPDGAPSVAIGDKESVKYDYLADVPKSLSRIVLAVDSDLAGKNLFHDLKIRLGAHRCLYVTYPDGCKDLNEVYLKHGGKAVNDCLSGAAFVEVEGLYGIDELPPLPTYPPFDVGIPPLKDHLRIRQGDFSVVTGIPSHGKSTFVNAIAVNLARRHGWITCFASFEQPPQTEHLRALRTLYHGRPESCQDGADIREADVFIRNRFCFIVPKANMEEAADLTWMIDKMVAAVRRFNARMIVIDPWNEIEHLFDARSMTTTQYIGLAIRKLKQFARDYQVHVMVIAHPAKLRKEKDSGEYPVPTAYDISDSAHWYNKPEQVVVVHRQNGKTLIRVAKSRYHYALGKPGDIELTFNEYDLTFA